MATYKVIQDIEADDKLVGPLTLRQFIYAGLAALCVYLCVFVATRGAAFLIAVIAPPALFFAFFAIPWSREQPTELWALARVRFLLKPRKRIWDQSGLKELVTITVPKRIEKVYSDGLSQTEVKSRLHALAETIDSRGWVIKNSAMNPYAVAGAADDRLIDPTTLPQQPTMFANETYDDMLDPNTNPKAQAFDSMLNANAQAQHQRLAAMAQAPQVQTTSTQNDNQQADYWFLNQPSAAQIPKGNNMFGSSVVVPGVADDTVAVSSLDEETLTRELRDHATQGALENSHLPTLLPLAEQERLKAASQAQQSALQDDSAMTAAPDAAILDLAHNDDLNIETIARQAKKAQADNDGEVVISLH